MTTEQKATTKLKGAYEWNRALRSLKGILNINNDVKYLVKFMDMRWIQASEPVATI